MATFTRQPFGELGSSRLQALQSAKNKQNAILPSFATSLKPSPSASTGKRQRATDIFTDDSSENMDPSLFCSPTKRPKTFNDAGFVKPAQFSVFTSPSKPSSNSSSSSSATPIVPSIRKSLSSPNTAKSTPISTSRGSPKNKRVHAISKRRASSSPFRRIDPPSFSATHTPSSLPFSIDAALSGSIPSYTPKPPSVACTPISAPQHVSPIDDAPTMPKAWFFDIHEDTPEQEAANLMQHSASLLDISSDDDVETKKLNEDLQRGKENVPPSEWVVAQQLQQARSQPSMSIAGSDEVEVEGRVEFEEPCKRPRLRQFVQDTMEEDRRPLGDLPPCDFYGEGCDASSYATVDVGIEKPSGLSRECDFSIVADEHVIDEQAIETAVTPQDFLVLSPATSDTIAVCVDEPVLASPLPEVDITPNDVAAPSRTREPVALIS